MKKTKYTTEEFLGEIVHIGRQTKSCAQLAGILLFWLAIVCLVAFGVLAVGVEAYNRISEARADQTVRLHAAQSRVVELQDYMTPQERAHICSLDSVVCPEEEK